MSALFNDLGELVSFNARRDPDRVAVRLWDGPARTYEQLEQRTARLANALRGLGLAAGDRVAAWLEDSVEYVELYGAAAKANVIVVPINSRLTHHEAAYQLGHTGARVLFFSERQLDRVAELPTRDDLKLVFVGTGPSPSGSQDYEALIADASGAALPPPPPDDPFMIGFTSGSTGRPKGAVLTHRSCMILATTQLSALRIPLYGVNIQAVSMSFPATIISHLMSHLLAGGTQVLAPGRWDSERLLDIVARERVTHMLLPAPILSEFTEAAAADPKRWESLVTVLHAGSRADPRTLEALADVVGTRYVEGWGMTEISGGVAAATTQDDLLRRTENFFLTVGRPVPGTRIKIVDDERNALPHDGETVGELVLNSKSLFAGYWQDPDATANAVVDGWYHSGDLGAIDPNGYIYISDRTKNLIRSGGMNVYPAEIELVLERCSGIAECAVIGSPHERWGEAPVAVVVRAPDSSLDEQGVIDFAVEHLATYKKPARVVFVDELPRTAGGKVMRSVVRELVESGS
jgi:acyl-CoA synthetase (AMP-forming)/AMP-acid ligase II